MLVPPRKLSLRRLGRLGHLGMSHRAREAGGASMPMRRHASARGSGVTKYITKFPRLTRRVTKHITKFSLPPIRVTKFETKFPMGISGRVLMGRREAAPILGPRVGWLRRGNEPPWRQRADADAVVCSLPSRPKSVFPQHLGRCATPRLARLGAEPRRVPFNEARAVPRDEFVPLDGRRAPDGRRRLNGLRNGARWCTVCAR